MQPYRRAVLAVLLFAMASRVGAAQLHILTTEVPPLAFMKAGKLSGFCVEMVEEIQRRLGGGITIELLPWARAYRMAQMEPNTVLVCPKRSQEREALFQWVGPLLSAKTNIYVKAGSTTALHTLTEARKLPNILVLRTSYSFQYLSEQGFQNLYQVSNPIGMLQMLMADRAPAMVLESVQLDAVMREGGVPLSAIEPVLNIQSPSSHIAFSLDVPKNVVQQWQAVFDMMKKDGGYSKIYRKWFPASDEHR